MTNFPAFDRLGPPPERGVRGTLTFHNEAANALMCALFADGRMTAEDVPVYMDIVMYKVRILSGEQRLDYDSFNLEIEIATFEPIDVVRTPDAAERP